MKKRTFTLFVFSFLLAAVASGQETELTTSQRSAVKKYASQAEKSFIAKDYASAIELYKAIDSITPDNPDVQCNIGICYLNSRHKARSLSYFQSAHKRGYNKNEIHYYLGEAYHYNHKFDSARTHFEEYIRIAKSDSANALFALKDARRKVEITTFAKELVEDSLKVSIENIGFNVNTEFDEYVPIVSADQQTMYFTSRRPTEFNEKLHDDGRHFEDIHVSVKDEKGNWTPAKVVSYPINKEDHDACIGISADAQTLFLYRVKDEHPSMGSIFESRFKDNKWTEPVKLGSSINTDKGWESSISVSGDGKRLYFSSDRPGGLGGFDLWYCDLQKDNSWGEPKNMGPDVNTSYNEDCPYIHFDNRTLFFSSDGHNTMGGFDVFSTVYIPSSGTWTKPRNIGYPINSTDDDMYFVYSSDGSKGYMSSALRSDTKGGKDIYQINRPHHSLNLILLKGKLINSETFKPLEAKITVTELQNKQVVGIFETDTAGKYELELAKGKNYSMQFESEGHLFASENVNLNDPEAIFTEKKVFKLKPIKKGNSIVLNNIFFEMNKYDIMQESQPELQKLTEFLQKNKNLVVKVNGYTDSVGNELYNLRLSKKRANEVRSFLISQGIPKRNVKIEGFGESHPVASNSTPYGRKMNRRTECQIYDIDTLSGEKKELLSVADTTDPDDIILEGVLPEKKKGTILYPTVTFGYNEGKELDEVSRKNLYQVSAAMKRIPSMKLSLSGNLGKTGKEVNNKNLYEERVKTVLAYFKEQGIGSERFTVMPFKPAKQVSSANKSREDNRKVTFALLEY